MAMASKEGWLVSGIEDITRAMPGKSSSPATFGASNNNSILLTNPILTIAAGMFIGWLAISFVAGVAWAIYSAFHPMGH